MATQIRFIESINNWLSKNFLILESTIKAMIKFKQTAQTSFILRYFSLFLFFYFSGFTLNAQPLNMDTAVKPTELKLYKFNPKDQPKGKGWLNITNVKQVKDTAYYFCKGLSIYSPSAVIVASKDKSIPLQASLHKWNWKETSKRKYRHKWHLDGKI